MWVTNGEQAQIYVLFAKDVDHPDFGKTKHGGTTAFIVDRAFPGFSTGKRKTNLVFGLLTRAHLFLTTAKYLSRTSSKDQEMVLQSP